MVSSLMQLCMYWLNWHFDSVSLPRLMWIPNHVLCLVSFIGSCLCVCVYPERKWNQNDCVFDRMSSRSSWSWYWSLFWCTVNYKEQLWSLRSKILFRIHGYILIYTTKKNKIILICILIIFMKIFCTSVIFIKKLQDFFYLILNRFIIFLQKKNY